MVSLLFSHLEILLIIFSAVNSKMSFKVESIGKNVYDLGEGPHWDQRSHALFHVDAFVGDVCRLNVTTGETEKFNLKDLVTIVIPYEKSDHKLLVSLGNKVIKLDWNTKKHEVIAEVAPQLNGKERFNDGKCDALGRLWIGTVLQGQNGVVPEGGSLYRLDNNQFTKMSDKFTLSNGMTWNLNNTKMYFNDSEDRKIYVFDYDLKKGTVSNKKVFINCEGNPDFKSGEYPDGMTIDKNGKLWIALYGGGRVVQINTETAKVENSVSVPSSQSTSVAFGGEHLDQLFVTSGDRGLSAEEKVKHPNAGKVFRVTAEGNIVHGSEHAHNFHSDH